MFWRNPDGQNEPVQDQDQQATTTDAPDTQGPDDQTLPEQKQLTGFFFWLRAAETEEAPKDEVPENEQPGDEQPQLTRPWYSFFSSDEPQTGQEEPEPEQKQTLSWFWPFSSAVEPELDTEDTDNAEVFRAARSTLENTRGNGHYAIKYVRGATTAHLAVCGTDTEQAPVPFNVKKVPALPNELLEANLVSAKAKQKALEEQRAQEQKAQEQKVQEQKAQEQKNQDSKTQGPDKLAAQAAAKSVAANPTVAATPTPGSPEPTKKETAARKPKEGASKTMETSVTLPKKPTPEAKPSRTPSVHSELQTPLVLPYMDNNFREITLITKARLLGEKFIKGDQTSEKHLYLSTEGSIHAKKRKRTKNVVVISMHSLLPPKFVRNYIAQSTGSAKQFGLKTIDAVARWLDEEEEDKAKVEISAICLEGQGTITDRVRESFRLLRNWKHEINSADMVLFVSSSIATPAAITLFSAMHQSEEFHLHRKKLGMLNMSGIHCGPYPGLNARVVIRAYYPAENEIIKELFELQKTGSETSKQLSADTKYLCENNVKMTLVGALNDQFVPLFSSVDSLVSHPNIFKSIFVDEQCSVPAFIVKLFLVILTMQNVGYLDQNMITDLSERLQGPVNVNNGSHGRIFDNDEVYDTGVRFAMETTTLVRFRALKFERPIGTRATNSRGNSRAGVGPARKPDGAGAGGATGATSVVSNSGGGSSSSAAAVGSVGTAAANESSTGEVWQSDKNLYHLPWNVRGVVNDLLAIKNIENLLLLMDLVEEYRRWEPTKAWREMKHCFAAFEEFLLDDLML